MESLKSSKLFGNLIANSSLTLQKEVNDDKLR